MPDALTIPAAARRAFERLAGDVARVFKSRLAAVIATSGAASVVFADSITSGDLDAVGALTETWHREGLETPLLLTVTEFRRSLDTFPVEYQTIVDRHVVIVGAPPFHGVEVPLDQLRRACEVQAKGHLIHLRQGWLDSAGHDEALAGLLVRSAAPLRALLTNVAGLHGFTGSTASGDGDRALAGAKLAGLPERLILDILALDDTPHRGHRLVDAMPAYLAASETLWAYVDAWRLPS
jgi:hypothetical protein